MATNLSETVEIMTEPDGSVDVVIPSNRLWDCVECFGENRLSACYRFSPPHFVAHVTASAERVRDTLRNWNTSSPDERPKGLSPRG